MEMVLCLGSIPEEYEKESLTRRVMGASQETVFLHGLQFLLELLPQLPSVMEYVR